MDKKATFAAFNLMQMLQAFLTFFQEKLIFLSSPLPEDYVYKFQYVFEEVNLTAKDGAVLNAIHFKVPQSKGVILYFHGNAGNLSRWGEITSYFIKFSYDVLVMDYRTYGKSTGELSEIALYEDAQLFYTYLKDIFREEDIIVYGRSLGATFAASVAAENQPKKLILESPFYKLHSIAKKRFPVLPVNLLLRYRFPTNKIIQKVSCELIIVHGTEDQVIPLESGKKLFWVAPMENKKFFSIEGGRHNDLDEFKEYHRIMVETFDRD